MPNTFLLTLHIPAIFNKEPLTNIGLSIKDRAQEKLVGLGAA